MLASEAPWFTRASRVRTQGVNRARRSLYAAKAISGEQFACVRILFGLYLTQHFLLLIPYAAELYSADGALPDGRANPTYGLFPSIFWLSDSPETVTALLLGAVGLSLCLTVGWYRRTAAVLLWVISAWLFNRNVLTSNPSLPYVGVLLLLTTLVPAAEPLSLVARGDGASPGRWRFPAGVFWCAWGLMALGYTFSGLVKLASPSWVDGTALTHVLSNPLARPGALREYFLALPEPLLRSATWGALLLEVFFAPLCLTRKGRLIAWSGAILLHLGILCFVSFADLTFGMLMVHLFTFDPQWLPPHRRGYRKVVFYDGDCAFCLAGIRRLMSLDTDGVLRYAPLQGETAEGILPASLREGSLSTLVYAVEQSPGSWELTYRSTAVLDALRAIGGFARLLSTSRVVPKPLRDALYRRVAANRHLLSQSACPLPTERERRAVLP